VPSTGDAGSAGFSYRSGSHLPIDLLSDTRLPWEVSVVALSGTLETFSLPDVLRLLSSTKKTGVLALDGDRGSGRVWVDDGAIVAAASARTTTDEIDGVVFELLRFEDASFVFDSGAEPDAPAEDRRDVEAALEAAEARLAEWRDIEAVVPSLDVRVSMVSDIDDDLTVTPPQWRVLAAVGTGISGHGLSARLDQGEYDVCRQLRDLVEAGMVALDELDEADEPHEDVSAFEPASDESFAPTVPTWHDAAEPAEAAADDDEVVFAEASLSSTEVSSLGANLSSFVAAGTVEESAAPPMSEAPAAPDAGIDLDDTTPDGDAVSDDAVSDDIVSDDAPVAEEDAAGDGDFLSQLSHLSPKAAAAIEATSSNDEDPIEDVDGVDDVDDAQTEPTAGASEDDLSQNLLLRFLSSAKQ